jgi:hypothetical protein
LESSKYGDVFQVRAFDLDAPNTANSKIIYTIESGAMEKFSIDANTGLVKLIDNVDLDRDVYGASYLLKIVAANYNSFINITHMLSNESTTNKIELEQSDLAWAMQNFEEMFLNNDSFTRQNYCFLRIQIIDVNNKKPYFLRNNE